MQSIATKIVDTNDLEIRAFHLPVWKDRQGNSHGGVMVYVKDTLHFKCRYYLEIFTFALDFLYNKILFILHEPVDLS